jgi:SAM-dependent methyltransferase
MGIGLSSLSLGNLTVRRPSRLSLDLGTGCGVQALLAARHSEKVICVDRNPRAVAFASSNAKLNGLTNVECREGDLFEPVRGLLFDLIVSNPPFVISPESRYIFRDGGMEGDAICRHIAGEAPRFLAEGGYFQMLCNWVEPAGENWRERLAGWFEGSGCDAWVLHTKRYDPADYASLWIRHTERDSHQEYLRRFEEWIAYYDRLGIGGMGGGIITLRKAGGRPNWFRADEAPEKTVEAGGEAILLGFELYDFLQTVREDAALLEARAHVSPYTVLDRVSAPFQGKWSDLAMELRLTRGLAYTAKLDGPMANFLACCDGEHPLGELLAKMSASLGVDPAAIAHSFCGLARRLIEMGFLLPPHLLPAEPENGDR